MTNKDELRRTFGAAAAEYHRARPSYPSEVIDEALGTCPRSVLEVGCGSGQATRAIAERCEKLVAIDISEDLVAIARRELPSVELVVGAFETVAFAPKTFDVVCAAQAFHWVDTEIGLPKARDVLVDGGRLSLFWNFLHMDRSETLGRVRDAILQHAPDFRFWPDSSDERYESYANEWRETLDESGSFAPARNRTVEWSTTRTSSSLLDWVRSFSWFRVLDDAKKAALLGELTALTRADEAFVVPMRTLLVAAETRS